MEYAPGSACHQLVRPIRYLSRGCVGKPETSRHSLGDASEFHCHASLSVWSKTCTFWTLSRCDFRFTEINNLRGLTSTPFRTTFVFRFLLCVSVGVFPEHEEILIRGLKPCAFPKANVRKNEGHIEDSDMRYWGRPMRFRRSP
jgi:hypothetical protein